MDVLCNSCSEKFGNLTRNNRWRRLVSFQNNFFNRDRDLKPAAVLAYAEKNWLITMV